MILQTAFDFFSFAPFPVFVVDSAGAVIFKNCHCARYLPEIRRGAKIFRHIKDKSRDIFSDECCFVEFDCSSPYFRAFVSRKQINGENYILFIFPSRMQFDDYAEIAEAIKGDFGGDAMTLFTESLNAADGNTSGRLYGEVLNFTRKYCDGWSFKPEVCDIESIIKPLVTRLGGAFRALGIRINGEIDENVSHNKSCTLRPLDFVFCLCRLVYAAARCSNNKALTVRTSYLEETNEISVCIKTRSPVIITRGDICELAPECIFESEFIGGVSSLKNRISFANDTDGFVTASYRIPCVNGFMALTLHNTYGKFEISKNLISSSVREIASMLKKAQSK